jgi:hypothetical protein
MGLSTQELGATIVAQKNTLQRLSITCACKITLADRWQPNPAFKTTKTLELDRETAIFALP